jgi:hypothetical protein
MASPDVHERRDAFSINTPWRVKWVVELGKNLMMTNNQF